MKKFVGFYYRCSFKIFLGTLLSLIVPMILSSSAVAETYGDFTYTVSGGTVTITGFTSCQSELTPTAVIPDTIDDMPVVSIGDMAFYYCIGLTSVTIPNSVTSIGSEAFNGCTSLTTVTIPDSVTSIGGSVFSRCSSLTTVTIGNSVTSIGNYAFYNCTSLTTVTIPDSVISIGDGAFYYCTGLTSVTIGNSVTSIGDMAFEYCTGLTSIVVDANNPAYSSQDGVLYNKVKTMLIQYPDGKSGGFTIPDSVTSIGGSAFSWCSGLTSVTIGNNVTSIEEAAFSGCTSLTSVTIPNSVTSIGNAAFNGCTSLTSVTIPDSVTSIGGSVFSGCTSLTSVTIPNSVTSIGNAAFFECSSLTSVTIPNSVTSIGNGAFSVCSSLTSVTIPHSVTTIGQYAFQNCTGLTSVTIGNSVTSIGNNAFVGCRALTSIVVDASNPAYSSQDGVLYSKDMTLLIQCPSGKSGGFTIPSGVTSIGVMAFYNCKALTIVTIPDSVTSIGDSAFSWCSELTKAYFLGNAPAMGSFVFDWGASNFSICYTAGSTGFTTPTWYGRPAAVCVPPTVINLSFFTATPKAGKVILQWNTESETDNAGFNLYRSESKNGEYIKINELVIPAQGSATQGSSYEFTDTDVQNRKTYYYKLEDIDIDGTSTMHGPVSATPRLIYGLRK